ncbi:hypothetical protein F5051DRAFT_31783, partial [Lentinula edodes]
ALCLFLCLFALPLSLLGISGPPASRFLPRRDKSQPHTAEGEAQMFGYMETLINHPYRVAELKGYLLRGTKYLEFWIVDNEVQYIPGQYQDIFAAGDPLTVHLCQIAIQEWNRRAVDGAPDNKDDDEEDGFDEFNNL